MTTDRLMKLPFPLPCSTITTIDGYCENPAMVAWVYRRTDARYTLQPICRSCSEAMAKLYGVLGWKAEQLPGWSAVLENTETHAAVELAIYQTDDSALHVVLPATVGTHYEVIMREA